MKNWGLVFCPRFEEAKKKQERSCREGKMRKPRTMKHHPHDDEIPQIKSMYGPEWVWMWHCGWVTDGAWIAWVKRKTCIQVHTEWVSSVYINSAFKMELRCENDCKNDGKHTESSGMKLSDGAIQCADGWWPQMEGADMGGHEGLQPFLRCALRSWSRPCGPRGGAWGGAGGRRGAGGGGAGEGGALMSRSTGGGAGGGARCCLPWEDWVAAASLPVDS